MYTGRFTRDEILIQGLELASSPTVIRHDMPNYPSIIDIDYNAYSIKWLNNALDKFHKKYPFSGDLKTAALSLAANVENPVLVSNPSLYYPTDYIVDVRNGLLVQTAVGKYARLERKAFQYFLTTSLAYQGTTSQYPRVYSVFSERFYIAPKVTSPISCLLWYYALPALLTGTDKPKFPDEYILIEFIRLKALEWTRAIEPGTADGYFQTALAALKAEGLLGAAEYEDAIPLENNQIVTESSTWDRNSWMGVSVAQ